jgi:hypothetical protein
MNGTSTQPRPRGFSARRLAERLFLGSVMALIATMVDRRLRRAFSKRPKNR